MVPVVAGARNVRRPCCSNPRAMALCERIGPVSAGSVAELLAAGPATGWRATAAFLGRLAGGAVFVVFGAGKFTNHASELASFQRYGLPAADAFVYVIGVV